jgi:exonuclease SbcD
MKVAITADVHLKTKNEAPERFNSLQNIFQQIKERQINNLIIAGDLFDKEFYNYSEFDLLCKEFSEINVYVIPGNHDYNIENKFFTSSNINIITKAEIKEIGNLSVLFIPFEHGKSIDEVLSKIAYNEKLPEKWILIGHGDYITGNKVLNPYEPGFYMPLTSKTVNKFNPLRVILGHIHKLFEYGKVIYPGSPCGLDITETGKRQFIIYHTESDYIEKVFVNNDKIYFIESLLISPFDEELNFLRGKIDQMIKNWQLTQEELKKVHLHIILNGLTKQDLKELIDNIKKILFNHGVSSNVDIDISQINLLKDYESERFFLFNKIKEKIDELNLYTFTTSKEKVLEQTMEIIFRE